MINSSGRRCQLTMRYSKKDEDVVFTYPKGEGTEKHPMLLCALFDDVTIKNLEELGYDPKTIKFSIAIDWSKPVAKRTFAELYEKIRDSVPRDLNQLSFWEDHSDADPSTLKKGEMEDRATAKGGI